MIFIRLINYKSFKFEFNEHTYMFLLDHAASDLFGAATNFISVAFVLPPGFARIEKRAEMFYSYSLTNLSPAWNRFPDLHLRFCLDFDQYVQITYRIVIASDS